MTDTSSPPSNPATPPAQPGSPMDEGGRERGLVIGRVWGVPIVLAPSWFIVAAVITAVFGPVVEDQVPGVGVWAYPIAAAFAVLLYASVLIHELGHVVVARAYGMPVRRVTLHLLGGVSELEGQMATPRREFWVSVAGPLLSLALGGLGWLALLLLEPSGAVRLLIVQLTVANLLVGVFNLLPGLPLDGGRVVRAAVWQVTGRPTTGTRAAAWAGRGMAVLAFALPFLLSRGQGPSIASVAWGAMISAFIWVGASQSLRAADHEERVPLLSARQLVRRAVPVPTGTPLALALQRMSEAGARSLVVVDADDQPVAVVSEAAVSAVPMDRRPWVEVGSVARRLGPGMTLPVDASGDDLLSLLTTSQHSEYLVVDQDDRVVGVLSADDVIGALKNPPVRDR